MLGLAVMSVRRKRACKKKAEAGGGRYCMEVFTNEMNCKIKDLLLLEHSYQNDLIRN